MSTGARRKLVRSKTSDLEGESKNGYFQYDRSEADWQKVLNDREESGRSEIPLDNGTYDNWRHHRMRAPLSTIVNADPDASWLTIGDGRYGSEAHFLLKSGAKNVHASDISDALLKVSSDRGLIGSFSAENAEDISFDDNTFDYVYCKEAFHHFPRPYVALYEMFRVANKAVILTEPRDTVIDTAPLQNFRNALKAIFGKKVSPKHGFETVGNYAYALSEREVEKFLLGMHYTNVAFIGCNDFYDPRIGSILMQSNSSADERRIRQAQRSIERKDLICRLGIRKTTILTAVLFKDDMTKDIRTALSDAGWEVKALPANPYL